MAQGRVGKVCVGDGGARVVGGGPLVSEKGGRRARGGGNGCGKSTRLRVLAGQMAVESGEVSRQPGLRVARLEQQVPLDLHASLFEVVAAGLGRAGELLGAYHRLEQGGDQDDSRLLPISLNAELALLYLFGYSTEHDYDTPDGCL